MQLLLIIFYNNNDARRHIGIQIKSKGKERDYYYEYCIIMMF